MQHIKSLKHGIAAFVVGFGALGSVSASAQEIVAVADGLNMWDGQWHFGTTVYGWLPWVHTSVQLPPIAGGGNPTIETQPSQYLKDLNGAVMFEGMVRKGDWSLWTDLVYMHMSNGSAHTKQIGLPGGDPTVSVSLNLNYGLKATIWTLAPSYTVLHNDIASLDVMAGFRYIETSLSLNTVLSSSGPLGLTRGVAFYPSADSWDGIVGIRGAVRLSSDGKWSLPYETDFGKGSGNTQWNAILGVSYHFRWVDVTLAGRNLTYNRTADAFLQNIRFTGPALGATFRW